MRGEVSVRLGRGGSATSSPFGRLPSRRSGPLSNKFWVGWTSLVPYRLSSSSFPLPSTSSCPPVTPESVTKVLVVETS